MTFVFLIHTLQKWHHTLIMLLGVLSRVITIPEQNLASDGSCPANNIWFKYECNRSKTHPNFDPAKVRTHDLQTMHNTFHVPETMVL